LSIFYNFYQYVIKASANGILHHSPQARSEICSCPEFDRATNYYDYVSDYTMKLALYKNQINGMMQQLNWEGVDPATDNENDQENLEMTLPIISGINLERVGRTTAEMANEVKLEF